jgi:hypothetical protein
MPDSRRRAAFSAARSLPEDAFAAAVRGAERMVDGAADCKTTNLFTELTGR